MHIEKLNKIFSNHFWIHMSAMELMYNTVVSLSKRGSR